MRKLNVALSALAWAAVATLMPLSALEPVGKAHAAERHAASASCPGGEPRPLMGCGSVQL